MAWRIGVDIGGTFTDVAAIDEASGRIGIVKLLTTPGDFSGAVVEGLRRVIEREGIAPAGVALLAHATTVVTNALFEKKGARAGLVTTRGFRDILELRRSSRADLYDLMQDPPDVLVPLRWRFEISERIDAAGRVVTPLAEDEIEGLVAAIREAGLNTVAVSLLFSFLNDAHERRLGDRLRAALPEVGVYLSCEVLPEIREFERTSTTAVCAHVGPLLRAYPAPFQARRPMGGAERGRRSATPMSCSALWTARPCSAASCRSTPRRRMPQSRGKWRGRSGSGWKNRRPRSSKSSTPTWPRPCAS